jgi:uncharacterized protein (DUF1501 family)
MKKSRRKFLKDSGLMASGLALASHSVNASPFNPKIGTSDKDLLLCVFQRGAADGLHSVVPHAESAYFNLRPQTAVNNSINLDGFFGLNPSLSAFKQIWDAGDLGIIHAVGSTNDSRSHFDSQDTIEFANFDKNSARTGWLAKYISLTSQEADSVFRAVSLNGAIQKSIRGEIQALTISNLAGFDINTHQNLYADTVNSIGTMFNNGIRFAETSSVLLSAIETVKQINPNDYPVENGANYQNNGFANRLKSLGVMIKAGLGTDIACVDIGGWDHHDKINNNYPNVAQTFSNALLAFYQDMGQRMENITILCMTEFGRRAEENASLGTDHGNGGVMYAIGKQVNGGQVYSQWPGLQQHQLNDGDLDVTTDFREVFSELLLKRLKYTGDLADIIPDYTYAGGIGIFK